MRFEKKDELLTIFCEGKIDSANAQSTGEEIGKIIAENDAKTIVFDFDGLTYISSAGLREFLKIAKKYKDIRIENASAEVYDVFEMTGFSKIIAISKKLRELSVEGCEIIGRGGHGVVYRLDDETIIKVFQLIDSPSEIRASLDTAKKLLINGIPVAISYDVVKVGDKYGAVFELLNTDTLGKFMGRNPEYTEAYAKKAAHLLWELHHTELPEGILPDSQKLLQYWVDTAGRYLNEEEKGKLRAVCDRFSGGKTFVHGDYHCGNIMVQDGELVLIDIDDACVGNPMLDMAGMYLTAVSASSPMALEETCLFLNSMSKAQTRKFWDIFEAEYYKDITPAELEQKRAEQQLLGLVKMMCGLVTTDRLPEAMRVESLRRHKEGLFQYLEKLGY